MFNIRSVDQLGIILGCMFNMLAYVAFTSYHLTMFNKMTISLAIFVTSYALGVLVEDTRKFILSSVILTVLGIMKFTYDFYDL